MEYFDQLASPPSEPWVLDAIAKAFEVQYGRTPADLRADLMIMGELFDPTARGSSIRLQLTAVPGTDATTEVGAPWLLVLLNGAAIVTPEGRAALDAAGSATWPVEILSELLAFYRHLAQKKIQTVTALLRGEGPLAHPAALASVLLLLINRSNSEEKAIPSDGGSVLDQAIQLVHKSFILAIAPKSEASIEQLSFRSGYGVSEATRRLGPNVIATGPRVFVRSGEERHATRFVANELRRRVRNTETAMRAFDALVAEYHKQRPILSAAGCAFERAPATLTLRESLRSAISD